MSAALNQWMTRSANTCHGCCTHAMSVMMITKLKSDRPTISLRPVRSARRAHTGVITAVTSGVTPRLRPDQTAIAAVSCSPSCWRYSGRNGITSVKPVKPMNAAIVTAA